MESAAFGAGGVASVPDAGRLETKPLTRVSETTWTRTGQKVLRCEPGQGRDAGVGRDHGQHVLEHEVERRARALAERRQIGERRTGRRASVDIEHALDIEHEHTVVHRTRDDKTSPAPIVASAVASEWLDGSLKRSPPSRPAARGHVAAREELVVVLLDLRDDLERDRPRQPSGYAERLRPRIGPPADYFSTTTPAVIRLPRAPCACSVRPCVHSRHSPLHSPCPGPLSAVPHHRSRSEAVLGLALDPGPARC